MRSASLHRVLAVEAFKASVSIWAGCPESGPCSSILVTRGSDRAFVLVNADAGKVIPLQIPADGPHWSRHGRLSPPLPHQAFLGRDGLLRILELKECTDTFLPGRPQCHWHTINPHNGQVLRSAPGNAWFMDHNSLPQLYHAKASLVLGMPDAGKLVIMDADSLREVARICAAPGLTAPADNSDSGLCFRSCKWSTRGDMLAVSVVPRRAVADLLVPQIRIHKTASGECLQSIELPGAFQTGLEPVLFSWSHGLDVLVVCWVCHMARSDNHEAASSSSTPEVQIMLLDPVQQFREEILPPPGAEWELSCTWTPCGRLLVAGFRRPGLAGTCIINPLTHLPVYTATLHAPCWCNPAHRHGHDCIMWSQNHSHGKPSDGFSDTVVAFIPEQHALIRFQNHNGEWTVTEISLKLDVRMPNFCSGKPLAPDGSYFIGACQLSEGKACLCHWDTTNSAGLHVGSPFSASSHGMLDVDWAPFPPGWSPMHACIMSHGLSCAAIGGDLPVLDHDHGMFPCIRLVDAKSHQVCGSWAPADLYKHMQAPALKTWFAWHADGLRWAPSARHLAVLCNGLVSVLSFQTAY